MTLHCFGVFSNWQVNLLISQYLEAVFDDDKNMCMKVTGLSRRGEGDELKIGCRKG